MRTRRGWLGAGLGGVLALIATQAQGVITVDTHDDWVDDNPGDCTCATYVGENVPPVTFAVYVCSLRAAIQTANNVGCPETQIVLGTTGTYDVGIRGTSGLDNEPPGAGTQLPVLPSLGRNGATIVGFGGATATIRQAPTSMPLATGIILSGVSNQLRDVGVRGFGNGMGEATAGVQLAGTQGLVEGCILIQNTAGVEIRTTGAAAGNVVRRSFIGTDELGTGGLGNVDGVRISSGGGNRVGGVLPDRRLGGRQPEGTPFDTNVISGNTRHGVVLQNFVLGLAEVNGGFATSGNRVQGNAIGVTFNLDPLPNGGSGVAISGGGAGVSGNFIGDDGADDGLSANFIAMNVGPGVRVDGSGTNRISRNYLTYNGGDPGLAVLGIDLVNGGNANLAAPAATRTVANTLSGTTCASCRIEVYEPDLNDPAAAGEGFLFLTSLTALANGSLSLDLTAADVGREQCVTLLAIDGTGNTSEFSQNLCDPVLPTVDLGITKTDDVDPVAAGAVVTYTLTVTAATGQGLATATAVEVDDPLPAGCTGCGFVSATPSAGTCVAPAAGPVHCLLGDLAPGASATVQVAMIAGSAGTLTNTASLANTGEIDRRPVDNEASETTTVQGVPNSDLQLTKTGAMQVDGTAYFSLTVTNLGPSVASSVVLTDLLPAALATGASTQTSQGTCGPPNPIICNLGSLAVGASASVIVNTGNVPPGTHLNTASVTSAVADANPANNSDSATVTVVGGPPVVDVPVLSDLGLLALVGLLAGAALTRVRGVGRAAR